LCKASKKWGIENVGGFAQRLEIPPWEGFPHSLIHGGGGDRFLRVSLIYLDEHIY